MTYDNVLLRAVATLETQDGARTIKGPNGEDSNNLFNIKDFSGAGFRAHDKAEGSNDAYRVYRSRQDSETDFIDLLKRRYPEAAKALETGDGAAFAKGLVAGKYKYATDPQYEAKLTSVIDRLRREGVPSATEQPVKGAAAARAEGNAAATSAALVGLTGTLTGVPIGPDFGATQDVRLTKVAAPKAGLPQVFDAHLSDPDTLPTRLLIERAIDMAEADNFTAPANWDYWSARPQHVAGLTDEDAEYLDEWGPKGPQFLARAKTEIEARRQRRQVYGEFGFWGSLGVGIGVGAFDPASWAAMAGVGKVMQLGKIGHAAFVAKGAKGAAVTSMVGENVASDVLISAIADAAGGQYSAGDYMLQSVASLGLSAIQARGVHRAAAEQALITQVDRIRETAIKHDVPTDPAVRTQAIAEQVDQIKKDVHDAGDTGLLADVPMIDAETRARIRDDAAPPAEPPARADESPPARPEAEERIPTGEATELPVETLKPVSVVDTPAGAALQVGDTLDFPKLLDDLEAKHAAGDFERTRARLAAALAELPDAAMTFAEKVRVRKLLAESAVSADKPLWVRGVALRDGNEAVIFAPYQRGNQAMDLDAAIAAYSDSELFRLSSRKLLELLAETDHRYGRVAKTARLLLDSFGESWGEKLDQLLFIVNNADAAQTRGAASGAGVAKAAIGNAAIGNKVVPRNLDPASVIKAASRHGVETMIHEIVHQVTIHMAHLWRSARAQLSPEMQYTMRQLEDLHRRFQKLHPYNPKMEAGASYASKNLDEFMSQGMIDQETIVALMKMPADPTFLGRMGTAFDEFVHYIKNLFGFGDDVAKKTGYDEFMWLMESLAFNRGGTLVWDNGVPVRGWDGAEPRRLPPDLQGATSAPEEALAPHNPMLTQRSRQGFAARLYAHATQYMAAHPIDLSRVDVATKWIGSVSDGLVMAASKNPIMQMAASILVETTTGAGGRRATAAMRKETLLRQITGEYLQNHEAAYSAWRRAQGRGIVDDFTHGRNRAEFDKLVFEEAVRRRSAANGVTTDPHVRRAADSMEAMYERARVAQVRGRVLGHENLPPTARGYVPQQLDGQKLADADPQQIADLEAHLAGHWHAVLGWDAQFATDFANYYVNRARDRAMKRNMEPAQVAGDSADVIRDALLEMRRTQTDPNAISAVNRALAGLSDKGQKHTRSRLDVGLDATFANGQRVMDFYRTDVVGLARSYINRTSGVVALTEFGVDGKIGVQHLRDAMTQMPPTGQVPTLKEIEAFDRTMGEMLGHAIPGEVRSETSTALRLLVGVQRLGALAYTQAAETWNMINHLGYTAVLSGIASVPRLIGEVGRVKRGLGGQNHILNSIEFVGGEFGSSGYKLVMPWDPPDNRIGAYVQDSGIIMKLAAGASHLQHKINGMRAIMAVQHRMVAEQITLRAMRYIANAQVTPTGLLFRDAKAQTALRDMGFDDDLVKHIRTHLGRVATFDASGRVTSLDITQIPNPRAATQFAQAVHRGVGQIIQGTFIGERTHWMHNDHVKLLAQLRTFGVTAAEKQWGRLRMNHGYAYAAYALVTQLALAVPIYLARVHAASVGMEDREEYIKKNTSPVAILRATMNYASAAGLAGDVLDATVAVAGGWNEELKGTVGGRAGQTTGVSGIVPAVGSVDAALRVVSGDSTLYQAFKQLPFSNLPYVVPVLNLLKE